MSQNTQSALSRPGLTVLTLIANSSKRASLPTKPNKGDFLWVGSELYIIVKIVSEVVIELLNAVDWKTTFHIYIGPNTEVPACQFAVRYATIQEAFLSIARHQLTVANDGKTVQAAFGDLLAFIFRDTLAQYTQEAIEQREKV
jgi:hypothetical protein